MKKSKKRCLILGLVLPVLIVAVLAAGVLGRAVIGNTEVFASSAEDNGYTLKVYMVGEPVWPFGPTRCVFHLFGGEERLLVYPFSIMDDGARAGAGNFRVRWQADCVQINVRGSEQPDREYILHFDGRVTDGMDENPHPVVG